MPTNKKTTDQKIKQLIELNDDLENYFSNTIIPQLFVDADLILRKFTPPAMKQFRFSPQHIGRPMEEMIDNIRYSTIIHDIQGVIASGEILESEIQTTDMRWFQMNIIPYVVKKENKTNGVIITFVDITNRIKVLRELERLNLSHETFIYSVSHDLRAPLANIEALVQLLLKASGEVMASKGTEGREHSKLAQMLQTSVTSMRTILNELSEITKIEGGYKEAVEMVSFETILQEVKMTIGDKIQESGATIYVDIQETEIEFSRKNLRSIVFNLLSNAIKYRSSRRKPEIHITTKRLGDWVQISVVDNGLGIADDKKDLLFIPFSRLEKEVEGMGIGLYLVKKIVENAGGTIEFSSITGQGSEFKILLKAGK
jgi:two-component system, OmpR family, phosphate regulon sensor histidine kinase PhoR